MPSKKKKPTLAGNPFFSFPFQNIEDPLHNIITILVLIMTTASRLPNPTEIAQQESGA